MESWWNEGGVVVVVVVVSIYKCLMLMSSWQSETFQMLEIALNAWNIRIHFGASETGTRESWEEKQIQLHRLEERKFHTAWNEQLEFDEEKLLRVHFNFGPLHVAKFQFPLQLPPPSPILRCQKRPHYSSAPLSSSMAWAETNKEEVGLGFWTTLFPRFQDVQPSWQNLTQPGRPLLVSFHLGDNEKWGRSGVFG